MQENTPEIIETVLGPQEILRTPLLNKGTSFTLEEREELGLNSLLPFHVSTIEEQIKRRYYNFTKKTNDLSRYLFLTSLQDRNEILFYRLALEHSEEMLPFIYTPTVGDASLDFSNIYAQNRGVYISYPYKDQMKQLVASIPRKNIDVIVITDGSRILGLGDVGVGGMTIPVGKLSLYTLFGGIHPRKTLPILLDVGTNNQRLLDDPLYLGWRHPRITGKEYDDFVDSFIEEIKHLYPGVLLQWEDFSKDHARPLLEKYQHRLCSFNDDIQGTASVALSAILAALEVSSEHLGDHNIAIAGGGSAGLGIADFLLKTMLLKGMSEEKALSKFYITDVNGLLVEGQESCDTKQKYFAQTKKNISSWKVKNPHHITLEEVIDNAKPTILLGLSAQSGIFTETLIKKMCSYAKRPIIFPLSNPTSRAEAHPKDLVYWSNGKAIVATGSPQSIIEYQDKNICISQCNNVYIFPAVGLAVIATKSSVVTDEMFLLAAEVLSKKAPILKTKDGGLFPRIKDLRAVSREIAIKVAEHILAKGYATVKGESAEKLIAETMWYPSYPIIKKSSSF